jgi:hypothetical protein
VSVSGIIGNTTGIVLPSFDEPQGPQRSNEKAEKVRLQVNPESQLAAGAPRLALFETWERALIHCATSQIGTGVPSCPEGNKS